MLRPGLFGRPCRGMRAQPVKGGPSAAETGRMRLEVKSGRWSRVSCGSVQRSIGELPGILEKFLSMVFFMVLPFSRKISY
jgi:hypothetical protein